MAVDATFLALALIVSLLESMLPPIVPMLPYAKIGIGNVVLLACFLLVGTFDGYIVLVIRCLLNAVFAANMASLAWSLPSSLIAYFLMTVLYKTRIFSVCGVSVVGGMAHNLVQICVASLIVGKSVFVYLPYMMLAGAIAGIVTGLVCYFIVKSLGTRFDKQFKTQPYVREQKDDECDIHSGEFDFTQSGENNNISIDETGNKSIDKTVNRSIGETDSK